MMMVRSMMRIPFQPVSTTRELDRNMPGCSNRVGYSMLPSPIRKLWKLFQLCSRLEGIIPALESAHALAHVAKIAPDLPADHIMVVNISGRGDKDVFTVAKHLGVEL